MSERKTNGGTLGWEEWALERMHGPCTEGKYETCIPLRGDSTCRKCYAQAKESKEVSHE